MTTSTYDPVAGLTSAMDTKGAVVSYSYDDFARLSVIKDGKGNIVKHFVRNQVPAQVLTQAPVYARIELENANYSSYQQGDYYLVRNDADIYLRFYSDEACTLPIIVYTNFSIDVQTNWTSREYNYSYTDLQTWVNSYASPSFESEIFIGKKTI
jgi:YD repeat-containing protein